LGDEYVSRHIYPTKVQQLSVIGLSTLTSFSTHHMSSWLIVYSSLSIIHVDDDSDCTNMEHQKSRPHRYCQLKTQN